MGVAPMWLAQRWETNAVLAVIGPSIVERSVLQQTGLYIRGCARKRQERGGIGRRSLLQKWTEKCLFHVCLSSNIIYFCHQISYLSVNKYYICLSSNIIFVCRQIIYFSVNK